MSAWTVERAYARPDGAVVRIERSDAGRWQVVVRRDRVLVGAPTQWSPRALVDEAVRARVVGTFVGLCLIPLRLPVDLAAALAEVHADAALVYGYGESATLDREVAAGRSRALERVLEQLAARQPRPAMRLLVTDLARRVGQARAAALEALPPEVRAPLEFTATATAGRAR